MIAIPYAEIPDDAVNVELAFRDEDGHIVWHLFDLPLIDIVPCKECKWWEKFEGGVWEEIEGEYGFCTLRVDAYKSFGEDNFCSYGERRTDENN